MSGFRRPLLSAFPPFSALLIILCGTALGQGPDDKGVATGKSLYDQHCVSCHGADGKGGGPAASALKVPPADLTAISRKYKGFPAEKVSDWIDGEKYAVGHGSREMPVWGKRFRRDTSQPGIPSEVKSLTRYLESIQKNQP